MQMLAMKPILLQGLNNSSNGFVGLHSRYTFSTGNNAADKSANAEEAEIVDDHDN